MAPIKFEEKIKDKLEKRTLSPSSEAWSKLSDRLDEDEKKSKKPIFWYLSIAAGLLVMMAVSIQFFNNKDSQEILPQIVKEDVIKEELNKGKIQSNEKEIIELVNEEVEVVINNRRDNNNERLPDLNIKIQTFGPEHIYPCQHYNKYGCIFASVPSYKSTSCNNDPPNGTTLRNLWILSSLLTGLQLLWISVLSKKHYRTSQWYGWILAYLCKKCFRNVSMVQQRNDPYKKSFLTSFHVVGKKFESCTNTDAMKDILNDISKIKFVDCSEMVENMLPLRDIIENIDCDEMTEVIIVDKFFYLENNDVEFEPVMSGIEYKLCCICDAWMTLDNNWDGIVWRRHG